MHYSSVVGSLMYVMICTRPDIAHEVGVVSRFLSNPEKCLCFGNEDPMLVGYIDADMDGDVDSRKSTSGYLTTFARGVVSWQSNLQRCVALSTTEAEYIVVSKADKEVKYMKNLLHELGHVQERYVLHCGNQSAIHLAKNPTFHSQTKHIGYRYHWIRNALEDEELQLEKAHTDDN